MPPADKPVRAPEDLYLIRVDNVGLPIHILVAEADSEITEEDLARYTPRSQLPSEKRLGRPDHAFEARADRDRARQELAASSNTIDLEGRDPHEPVRELQHVRISYDPQRRRWWYAIVDSETGEAVIESETRFDDPFVAAEEGKAKCQGSRVRMEIGATGQYLSQ